MNLPVLIVALMIIGICSALVMYLGWWGVAIILGALTFFVWFIQEARL